MRSGSPADVLRRTPTQPRRIPKNSSERFEDWDSVHTPCAVECLTTSTASDIFDSLFPSLRRIDHVAVCTSCGWAWQQQCEIDFGGSADAYLPPFPPYKETDFVLVHAPSQEFGLAGYPTTHIRHRPGVAFALASEAFASRAKEACFLFVRCMTDEWVCKRKASISDEEYSFWTGYGVTNNTSFSCNQNQKPTTCAFGYQTSSSQ